MERTKAVEVLNFYRNQHYSDPLGTEERELAEAINEILPHYAALQKQEPPTLKVICRITGTACTDCKGGPCQSRRVGVPSNA